MIRLFTGNGKSVFFKRKWANAVTNWLLGVHSPSGTITIRNTANPGENKGPSIDVDTERVSQLLKERLNGVFMTENDVRNALEGAVDNAAIVMRNGKATIDETWISRLMGTQGSSSSSTTGGLTTTISVLRFNSATSYVGGHDVYATVVTLTFTNGVLTATSDGNTYTLVATN